MCKVREHEPASPAFDPLMMLVNRSRLGLTERKQDPATRFASMMAMTAMPLPLLKNIEVACSEAYA